MIKKVRSLYKRYLYFVGFLALSQVSIASADSFVVHLASYHTSQGEVLNGKKLDYNQINPGIGYEFSNRNIELGVYKNSDYKTSFYVLKDREFYKGLGYSYGVATGYQNLLTPVVTGFYEFGDFTFRGVIAPKKKFEWESGLQAIFSVSLKIGKKKGS
jgi:hypothetical protein